MAALIVIMGVSGCGKSTTAQALSSAIGAPWLEGDDFHPANNIAKMTGGTPLTDEDRGPWVDAILAEVKSRSADRIILACSALTPFVQSRLARGTPRDISWILLTAPAALIAARLSAREGHFMPPTLLQSQYKALTPPVGAIECFVDQKIETIVSEIQTRLNEKGR